MTDNQFDDLIKSRLESHESVVPANMWKRITENDKGRKGGFIPRWFTLSILLLLTGFIITYFTLRHPDNIVNDGENNPKKFGNDKAVENKENSNNQDILSPRTPNSKHSDNFIISSGGNKQIPDSALFNLKKSKKEVFYNKQPVPYKDKTLSPDIPDDNDLANAGNTSIFTDSLSNSQTKTSTGFYKDSASSAGTENEELVSSPDKFSLELYASPDIPFNSIGSAGSNYEQVLKNATSVQLSYTFGARLGFEISKRVAVKMGVQYAQVNEKIVFTDSASGENHVSKNRYKFIDIPVFVSYRTAWPGYFETAINTGILVNITAQYKGAIPGLSGEPVIIDDAGVYYHNTGVSLYLGVELSKELNKRIAIFCEPYLRYHVKNMVNNFQPFDQKIHTAGLSLGVKYHLFKKEK